MMQDFNAIFDAALAENFPELTVDGEKKERFRVLAEALTEKSAVMNLTAITDLRGIVYKHFIDSFAPLEFIPQGANLLDVGAGAGFPSLPIAIMRPDVKVTSLDSTGKKLGFITYAAEKCGLDNVRVLNARAEEAAILPQYREQFDAVASRAVARLNVLCELCIPFVRVGGVFLALKGADADGEYTEAKNAFARLGCKIAHTEASVLRSNDEHSARSVIVAEKTDATPSVYPRKYAAIKKAPL